MSAATFLKFNKTPILYALLSVAFYAAFAYDLERTDFTKLLALYGALFFIFYKLLQVGASNFRFLVAVAIAFRLVFLGAIPNLSQDFYRFIWDGRMLLEGFNPYLYTPKSLIEAGVFPMAQAQELYHGMGLLNGSHFTNYPPIKQLVFALAALCSGSSILGSVVVFRMVLIAADLGTLYFGKKLLKSLGLPIHGIFWYVLNPFIIIELTGNLHFEGVMVFFLAWSLYLLQSGKWQLAAVILGLSISVKLVPLLFLPLFYQWFKSQDRGLYRLALFYAITVVTILLLFLPFWDNALVGNYLQTTSLWLNRFEFNASIYYLARAIGYAVTGYNAIAILGKVMLALLLVAVLGITFLRNNRTVPELATSMLFLMATYLFLSTTVHPWYLTTLLVLSVLTTHRFPWVWTAVVVLSYAAYSHPDYRENLWLLGLEYLLVFAVFIWEVFYKNVRPIAEHSK